MISTLSMAVEAVNGARLYVYVYCMMTETTGANPSTTLQGSTEMARPEGPKSEARWAEMGGVLVERMFPYL